MVENLLLTGIDYGEILAWMQCTIVGPARRVVDAMPLATDADIDAAILNISLNDGHVFPVAYQLRKRRIPFLFASGYDRSAIPQDLRDAPLLTKPIDADVFAAAVRDLLALRR